MSVTKLRFNLSSSSLAKSMTLFSNSLVLATNSYLLGRSVLDHFRDRKRERILENLEIISQTLGSIGSLSKVITNVLDENANDQ
ncbi:hypothetical protein E3V33_00150 [Candidatus Marinimicrobia bacterium MT.SAG.4]|nr:hypothetical protein E3V33_00150 [Candidatus Marinimicrobia bacterium MT.SAG.4]